MVTGAAPGWGALRDSICRRVVLPGSSTYQTVRKSAIANFHGSNPQAVVRCETPEDVSETISFARRHGLARRPRSGGHCFAGRSSTEGIVIDVSPMDSVAVSGGVARVGAGARLGEVYDTLDEHGLTIPAGCGPTVGISGLTLGGGLGILGRKHGLTSDSLLAAQVVLADGGIVECDEHHEPDLFWALRGAGGGNFGVVTSLAFRTVPAPAATAFHLTWPHAHAAEVTDAWQNWSPAAPDELAASLLLIAPSDPDRPPVVNVFGAMVGTESDTEELLDELVARAGRRTRVGNLETCILPGDQALPRRARPGRRPAGRAPYSKSEFFRRPLPREAVEALVENFSEGRVAGESRELDFTPWGGAYNRVPAEATAFAHRDELFLLQHVAVVDPDASGRREGGRAALAGAVVGDLVRPWGSGGVYPNWPDPDLEDWTRAYHGGNLDRLMAIKEKVRSGRLLSLPPVGPASSTQGSRTFERWIAGAKPAYQDDGATG